MFTNSILSVILYTYRTNVCKETAMSRNKYPEQTIQKILDTSFHLFSQKGYDKTTIQDIVNELGMSKGAIYHHFKSKEEILEALGARFYENMDFFEAIHKRKDLNGLEKLREIFLMQISDMDKSDMDAIVINIWKDPKFFMLSMEENLTQNAPLIESFLEEGIQDGSIRKQDTKCAAQILILLLNFWLISPITEFSTDELPRKIHYLRDMSDSLGIAVINDEIEEKINDYFQRITTYV